MKEIIKDICDKTVKNYKRIRDEFRYDGDYINHFAAIVYSNGSVEISTENIKKIRTYIKNKTSRMSCFRGDILYMISFLIAKQEEIESFTDEVLNTYDELVESGFNESQYLVLVSYAFTKFKREQDKSSSIKKMKEIYEEMKFKHKNLTNEEDYVECALLALSGKNKDIIHIYMDSIINSIISMDMYSKNGAQGLTVALLLNENNSSTLRIKQLLLEFEKRDIKIGHQFLPFIGSSTGEDKPEEYCEEVNRTIEYLCGEEYEYEYYMDKSFRVFIALSLIEFSKNSKQERYLEELLAMGVYSFIVSKNQGLLSEVLA